MRVRGAGVIPVYENEVLLVKGVSGKWGFPKGYRENHERLWKETAQRELTEETTLRVNLTQLRRPFLIKKKRQCSRNCYFLLRLEQKPTIQWNRLDTHEISAIQWFSLPSTKRSTHVSSDSCHLPPLPSKSKLNLDAALYFHPASTLSYIPPHPSWS